MNGSQLIGRRVKYTGKDHPNCGTKLEGSTGIIIEYHKKVGKGKAYSAHVIIRVDNMPHVVFNTAYPFTTWAFIEDVPASEIDRIMLRGAMVREEAIEDASNQMDQATALYADI